uniref:Copper transporter n=1 Tax=Elaeophora elaphi TaxID=1147741 RepID=A0A0R3RTL7_9BILA
MYRTFSYVMFYGKEQALFYIVMMYIVTIVLAVELIRCILKLLYERKKYQTSKKEIPILLADKDSLGENIVYKKTVLTSLPKTARNDDNFAKHLNKNLVVHCLVMHKTEHQHHLYYYYNLQKKYAEVKQSQSRIILTPSQNLNNSPTLIKPTINSTFGITNFRNFNENAAVTAIHFS